MTRVITIIGKSGAGKSTSLRRMNPNETFIIKPNNKALPFPGSAAMYKNGINTVKTNKLNEATDLVKELGTNPGYAHFKTIVLEDFTHYMNARTLSTAFRGNDGYGKWNTFGADVYNLIVGMAETLERPDLTIVVMGHTDEKDDGTINMKTSGKLLDREVDIPSYMTYQLYAHKISDKTGKIHNVFMTNGDGKVECKTPMHYFLHRNVPNDLSKIIERINLFENMDPQYAMDEKALMEYSTKLDEQQYPDFDFSAIE